MNSTLATRSTRSTMSVSYVSTTALQPHVGGLPTFLFVQSSNKFVSFCYSPPSDDHMEGDMNVDWEPIVYQDLEKYYRKVPFEELPPAIKAKMYLLFLYIVPLLSTTYSGWTTMSANKIIQSTTTTTEAYVCWMFKEGQLEGKKGRSKTQFVTDPKSLEAYCKLNEAIAALRATAVGGKGWDDAIQKVASMFARRVEKAKDEARAADQAKRAATDAANDTSSASTLGTKRQKKMVVLPLGATAFGNNSTDPPVIAFPV